MSLIDAILNIACLLLWLNWRILKPNPQHAPALTLAGTLKRVGSSRSRQKLLLVLLAILFGRALIYWQIGPSMDWTPHLQLDVTTPAFDSTKFSRMFLYSFLSFGHALGIFYLCLLFLSLLPSNPAET